MAGFKSASSVNWAVMLTLHSATIIAYHLIIAIFYLILAQLFKAKVKIPVFFSKFAK